MQENRIRFNMLVFGDQETGQSYHLQEMLMAIQIPGTFEMEDDKTAADMESMICLIDEIPLNQQ